MPFFIQTNKTYLLLALGLFLIELYIALYVRDWIIRPYGGDFLVVVLLYCLLKGLWDVPVFSAAMAVLLFSFLIETLQYFELVRVLGLEQSRLACIVIGTSFHWHDLLAYTLGILLVLGVEKTLSLRKT